MLQLIYDLLQTDDCDIVAHLEENIQYYINCLSRACKSFGFTISMTKAEVIYQSALGKPYIKPFILVDGKRLMVIDKFIYLASLISFHDVKIIFMFKSFFKRNFTTVL